MIEDYFKNIIHIPHFYIIRMTESRLMSDYVDKDKGPFLDLGCGDGSFSRSLELSDIYAIDIDEPLIKNIKDDGYYKAVHIASASAIPFQDNFFITVFSNCALEHMDNIDDVLKAVKRVLKKGGNFIFTVPTMRFFDKVRNDEILNEVGLNREESIREYNKFHHHVNIFDIDIWKDRLERSGFHCVRHEYYLPGIIGEFVARMDVLYSIGGSKSTALLHKLEEGYDSPAGQPLRQYFECYLANPHTARPGTHLIVKAESI